MIEDDLTLPASLGRSIRERRDDGLSDSDADECPEEYNESGDVPDLC